MALEKPGKLLFSYFVATLCCAVRCIDRILCFVAFSSTVFTLDRKTASEDNAIKLENSRIVASVSAATGVLQQMSLKDSGVVVKTDLQFVRYGTRPGKERSGAYLFLPDGEAKVGLLSVVLYHLSILLLLHCCKYLYLTSFLFLSYSTAGLGC